MKPNSQEYAIYRSLAGQIQLGFFIGGNRFPCVLEVASRYQVSYCPAQRAVKALEEQGLIRLCRGKETQVLAKPYPDYLRSADFLNRAPALADLIRAMRLFTAPICAQGLDALAQSGADWDMSGSPGKRLYTLFDAAIRALNNRTVQSLYYDIGAFAQSAFLDLFRQKLGRAAAEKRLAQFAQQMTSSLADCQAGRPQAAQARLEDLTQSFLGVITPAASKPRNPVAFAWEPRKGRLRYCDVVSVDLLRRISQGVYAPGTRLPRIPELADNYHVSPITIRRALMRLTRMDVTKPRNGVGVYVWDDPGPDLAGRMRDLMTREHLRLFLEALQLLSLSCEPALALTLPHCPAQHTAAIAKAVALPSRHQATASAITACLQAVVHCCPVVALREIYGKITLLLLSGSLVRLNSADEEAYTASWPELSAALVAAVTAGDAAAFGAAFRRMAEDSYQIYRQKLRPIGVP